MYAHAATISDDEKNPDRPSLVKHAVPSESHEPIGAMVALARSEHGIPVALDQLDRNPWLLNVKDGTLDLRTGKLRQHRREDLLASWLLLCTPLRHSAQRGWR